MPAKDEKRLYTFGHVHSFGDGKPRSEWEIVDCGTKGYCSVLDPVIWSAEYLDADIPDNGEPPANVRAEYERLIGYDPATWRNESAGNIVEMMQDDDADCAFDQPCKWGHRVEGHAVYCHNPTWLYAPSKCRRGKSWSDDEWPHEGCAGFSPNKNARTGEGLDQPE